ncbi:hypothetical protein ACS0TY_006714 [Phlomoides rotata]
MLPLAPVKREIIDLESDFPSKRKQRTVEEQRNERIYTCEFPQCPHSDYRMGFNNQTWRNNHQNNCQFRFSSSERLIAPIDQINNESLQAVVNESKSLNVFELGIPEDGQRMISELMSSYDNAIMVSRTTISSIPSIWTFFWAHTATNDTARTRQFQFDHCKSSFNSSYNADVAENFADFRFDSPFSFTPGDFSIDPLPKQEVPSWYL